MPGSYSSLEAEEGNGAGSDDESCMSCRGSVSDRRWSRMTGGTKGWRLRGVEWRVKLSILPCNNASVDAMRRATADGRRKYADLRRPLLVDPHIMDEDQIASQLRMDNPQSQDPESVWGRYFRNAELEKTIDKDLSRLYPERGEFFQSAVNSSRALHVRQLCAGIPCGVFPLSSFRRGRVRLGHLPAKNKDSYIKKYGHHNSSTPPIGAINRSATAVFASIFQEHDLDTSCNWESQVESQVPGVFLKLDKACRHKSPQTSTSKG